MKKVVAFAALFMAGAMLIAAEPTTKGPETGKYNMVVNAYDWGPGADKVIVNVGKKVDAKKVNVADFSVDVTMQGLNWATFSMGEVSGKRSLVSAYTCDASGKKVSGKSQYVAVELSVSPSDALSNPFVFCADMMNRWSEPYTLTIKNSNLGISTSTMDKRISPLADKFKMNVSKTGDITLHYGAYEPEKHGKKVPLIIWCHGMGEGGEDPYIVLIGNNVVNLINPEIQKLFGKDGAYVLAPQTAGFWLQTSVTGGMETWASNEGTPAQSAYTQALMNLIDSYVKANPSIDTNRIYIGGCSNGGYMTMNMIIEYPEYFAAAYPVCEAYLDSKIDDAKLAKLVPQHIWFTAAKNDTTVIPEQYVIPTVERLKAAGAKDVHFTLFDDVHDTTGLYKGEDGKPYQYMGHWSWIYTLKNECVDNGVTVFKWLASQSK